VNTKKGTTMAYYTTGITYTIDPFTGKKVPLGSKGYENARYANMYLSELQKKGFSSDSAKQIYNYKNQILPQILGGFGGNSGTGAPGNTSTDWGSNMYNTGAQRLTDTYNKAVQSNINDANRRGLFGSSIAAQASQDTAKAYGQGLAELAANIGAQEAQYGLTQQQINNQRLNTLLGLFD